MAQVVTLLLQLILGQRSLQNVVQHIYALLGASATYEQAETIYLSTYASETALINGLYSLENIYNAVVGGGPPGGPTIQDVLDAIAALPAGSDIVIPPAGDNAEAVWLYQGGFRDQTGNMLSKLDETNFKLGPRAAYIAPATPWFALYYPTSFID